MSSGSLAQSPAGEQVSMEHPLAVGLALCVVAHERRHGKKKNYNDQ